MIKILQSGAFDPQSDPARQRRTRYSSTSPKFRMTKVGDGTTSACVLVAECLREAEFWRRKRAILRFGGGCGAEAQSTDFLNSSISHIQIIKKVGGKSTDSYLDEGFILDKSPKQIENSGRSYIYEHGQRSESLAEPNGRSYSRARHRLLHQPPADLQLPRLPFIRKRNHGHRTR
ncbi:hypothetical protein AX14_011418 [Amanita brunnescens Koide BX004]|nr:hypothetical protein AX14_011418 [Amanita brunnescens Koide BX004]